MRVRKCLATLMGGVELVVLCDGRDHMVSLRTEHGSCDVFNVHVEPSLTKRHLRQRLVRIPDAWPNDPDGLGVTIGD